MKPLRALLLTVIVGCGSSKPNPQPPPPPDDTTQAQTDPTPTPTPTPTPAAGETKQKSLYERLGGEPAIKAVVEEFVARTTTDPVIKFRFFNTDAAELKRLLVEFVCMATGGPCKYTGRDMETAHAGMDLVEAEWNALVGDLVGTLDKFKVPEKEKGELLGALGPLKPQIVVKPERLKPIDQKKLDAVTKLAAKLKNPEAVEFLNAAVVAGKHGQRVYAEQLFSRAEIAAGPKALAAVAATFRAGAPKRVTTPTKKMKDDKPQPQVVGGSEADEPDPKPAKGQLTGTMTLDGKTPTGKGVVMLWPKTGKGKKRTPKQRVIEQRDKMFAPQVMAVPVGSTVSFPNFDNIYHNVFSLSKAKAFDLGMYKSGETREIKLDKPGVVRLGCNLHAAMSAWLIVVDAPHYVIPDASGKFTFKSLKPGKYKMRAWNERSGEPVESEIEIKEGPNETKVDVKSGGTPAVSPDKFGTQRM